jgi:hypothetical protein
VPVGYKGDRSDLGVSSSYLTDISQNAAARRISNAAMDDTDALMTASKRNDRQLLSDINNRLANASFQQPVVVRRSSISSQSGLQRNRPPLPPSSSGAGSTGGKAPPAYLQQQQQRYSIGTTKGKQQPILRRRYYDDDDDEINLFPPTPVTTSVIRSARAASVPPRLPVLPATATAAPTGSSRMFVVATPARYADYYGTEIDGLITHSPKTRVTPPPGYDRLYGRQIGDSVLEHPSRYNVVDTKSALLSPVADLAIRQAHRNLDRIDREIKFSGGDQPKDSSNNTKNGPVRLTTKTLIEVGPDYMIQRPATGRLTYRITPSTADGAYRRSLRTASLSPARSFSRRGVVYRDVSPLPPAALNDVIDFESALNGAGTDDKYRHFVTSTTTTGSTVPLLTSSSSSFLPPVETEVRQWFKPIRSELVTETRLFPTEMYRTRSAPRPATYSTYSSSKTPSRYVEFTGLRDYAAPGGGAGPTVSKSVPPSPRWDRPPPPASSTIEMTSHSQPSDVRPKLSDTRRKVREVLCKVKKDPHYFD